MSEFPEWMEEYFGLSFEPSYKQARAIHNAYRQVNANAAVIVDESAEFTPAMWDYLVERIRAEKKGTDDGAKVA